VSLGWLLSFEENYAEEEGKKKHIYKLLFELYKKIQMEEKKNVQTAKVEQSHFGLAEYYTHFY
jgi:hypothetical protein